MYQFLERIDGGKHDEEHYDGVYQHNVPALFG